MAAQQIPDLKFDDNGLIPAVVQDWFTGQVLMVAWMNRESVQKTVETGTTWFYSRSRKQLWNKGETSGHVQKVRDIRYDCDSDTLLVLAEQTGSACHTGEYTCFYRTLAGEKPSPALFSALADLSELIEERREQLPPGSYTTSLFEKGTDTILKKVGEEASELIVAAKGGNRDEVRYEAADLFYHVAVLLAHSGVPLAEVLEELRSRWK